MKDQSSLIKRASLAARDLALTQAVIKACDHAAKARERSLLLLPDPSLARNALIEVRRRSLERLPELLDLLAAQLSSRGFAVHKAQTASDAIAQILDVLRHHRARLLVKAKSMTGEEIGLTDALAKAGLDVVETDLGEFIVQLRAEPPSHILAPALHLTRSDVRRLFEAHKIGAPQGIVLSDDPRTLAEAARAHLRSYFIEADAGIIGVNIAIASTGHLVTVSNEGNARLCATLPKVLIALVGLEKVVETPKDAAKVLRLLARNATGQIATTYVSLLRGPKDPKEPFGPTEIHVILLDNGRTRIVQDKDLRDILRCIRCGACLNVCPVYRTIGGHAYGTTYPGPMGILWTAGLEGLQKAQDLLWASTLCRECSRVCPSGIDISPTILRLRSRVKASWRKRLFYRLLGLIFFSHKRFTLAIRAISRLASAFFNLYQRIARLVGWTTGDAPSPAKTSFREHFQRNFESGIAPASGTPIKAITPPQTFPPTPPEAQPSPISPLASFLQNFTLASGEVAPSLAQVIEDLEPSLVLAGPDCIGPELLEIAAKKGIRLLDPTDPATTLKDAEKAEVGITRCQALIAETGSILVLHGPGHDRIASLLPPVHLVIASPSQVVESLEEALHLLQGSDHRHATLITGPSRTADIEKTLILGMHGPKRLILIMEEAPPHKGAEGNEKVSKEGGAEKR